MASVILDVTTRGLDEAINNVRNVPNLITIGAAQQMVSWYNTHCKKTMLEIIETGQGVENNVGQYADWKASKYGITHGLGILEGKLYFSVSAKQPAVKETRGKEVRLVVAFNEPYYLAYVVDGTSKHIGRDFITIAKDRELPKLVKMISQMFEGLDFTLPYPQLISNVMGPNTLPSLRSYG